MSPRRVSDTFTAGMITDVVGAPNSLYRLHNAYVRRSGEISNRGGIRGVGTTSASAASGLSGCGAAEFHPNFGTFLNGGLGGTDIYTATSYAFQGSPLQPATATASFHPALPFTYLSEGASYNKVIADHAASTALQMTVPYCPQSCKTGTEIVFAGDGDALFKWGGGMGSIVSAGSATVATSSSTASRVVSCTSASAWANVQAGQFILLDGIGEKTDGTQRAFRITSVLTVTSIEIEQPVYSTAANHAYRIQNVAAVQSPDGVWNGTNEYPTQGGIVCYHKGRLWTAVVSDSDTTVNTVFNFDRIRWSGSQDEQGTFDYYPATATAGSPGSPSALAAATAEHFFSHIDLWHHYGYVDVFPGIGGAIKGLVSLGNELIIIKSEAMFRLTGDVTYDGKQNGLDLQIISQTVGANSIVSFDVCKAGLVVASRDGLYLYQEGGQLKSLTEGRISTWWEDQFNGPRYKLSVNALEDVVIVQPTSPASQYSECLMWNVDQDYFWTADLWNFHSVVTTYNNSDDWICDYGFMWKTNSSMPFWTLSGLTFRWGYQNTQQYDTSDTSGPKVDIITQALPISDEPFSEGRVNNVLVHGLNYDGSSDQVFDAYLYSGATPPPVGSLNAIESCNTQYTLEYGVDQNTEDRIVRIPVDSMTPSPCAYVRLYADAGSIQIQVFSIGVEYTPANMQGPSA